MLIEKAKTVIPTYERGVLINGEEIAPDVYMDHLPQNGEIQHIADNLYLSGNELENLDDLNNTTGHFKHIFVKRGSCQIQIGNETVALETGSILHLGRNVRFQIILEEGNESEFLTILHDPQDISEEIKNEWDNKWHVRSAGETQYGYWIGAFVDNQFPPAKSEEVAVGTKTLSGPIFEAEPHSHNHQLEFNAVLHGAYVTDVYSPYDDPQSIVIHDGEVLIVGEGAFSGTKNITTLTDECVVFLIQTPNLQPSEDNKNFTTGGLEIKGPTWSQQSLSRRKQ